MFAKNINHYSDSNSLFEYSRVLHSLADVLNGIILETILFWAMDICCALFVIEKVGDSNSQSVKTDRLILMRIPVLFSV